VVQSRFASDLILCAATFVGEIVRFEFDCFESFLKKGGALNSRQIAMLADSTPIVSEVRPIPPPSSSISQQMLDLLVDKCSCSLEPKLDRSVHAAQEGVNRTLGLFGSRLPNV